MSEGRVLTPSEVVARIEKELKDWKYSDGYIVREYHTKNWKETVLLANAIAYIAEVHYHHPDLELSFRRLKVKIKTHEVDGITEKDFQLARAIEDLTRIV